jgi:nucleotide-binding universal stress UspA family protein
MSLVTEQRRDRRRIVVGVSMSYGSVAAVRWALDQAERVRGELLAVHAVDPRLSSTAAYAPPPPRGDVLARAETTLEDLLARAASTHPHVPVRGDVRSDAPEKALVDLSRHADLLVMGTDDSSREPTGFLGPVTRACLRSAACPVVLVPHDQAPEQGLRGQQREPGRAADEDSWIVEASRTLTSV